MGGGSSTARLASSTSRQTPISQAMTQHGRWQFHRPSCILHVTTSPRSCEWRPRTGGGRSTTRLASSMSRRAPDLASNDPSWAVAVPLPVSHPPRHGEPQSREQRPSTGGGSSPARLASRLAPGLASNDPAQAVAVPPPVSRPPRHGEPPDIVSKDPAWVVELPLPVLHPHCGEASILFTFRIQISLLKVYTKYKINYITIIVIAKLSNLRKLSVAD